jgi:hypothetical protein
VSRKRETGHPKRPTAGGLDADGLDGGGLDGERFGDGEASGGLSSGVIRPMRSVLLGEASSGVPRRRADSLSRRLVSSIGLRRTGSPAPEPVKPDIVASGSGLDPGESGSGWPMPEPEGSGTAGRPVPPRRSLLPPKHVLAVGAAAVVIMAVVVALAVNSAGRAGGGRPASQPQGGPPPASATAGARTGDFGTVPGPSGSTQPAASPSPSAPAPSSPPPAASSAAKPPAPAPRPSLRRVALYSVPADVHADGPSGKPADTVLGSTLFPDSTSMFVGCSEPATLTYRLDGSGVRLTATAGLTGDGTPGDLVARVTVTGDGRTLANVTVSLDRQASVAADLSGVRTMVVSAQRVSGTCQRSGQPYGVLGAAQLLRKA